MRNLELSESIIDIAIKSKLKVTKSHCEQLVSLVNGCKKPTTALELLLGVYEYPNLDTKMMKLSEVDDVECTVVDFNPIREIVKIQYIKFNFIRYWISKDDNSNDIPTYDKLKEDNYCYDSMRNFLTKELSEDKYFLDEYKTVFVFDGNDLGTVKTREIDLYEWNQAKCSYY